MKKRSKDTVRALAWALAQTATIGRGRLCWCGVVADNPIGQLHSERCEANLQALDDAATRLGGTIERGDFAIFEPRGDRGPQAPRTSVLQAPHDPTTSPEELGLIAALEVAAKLMSEAHAWQARTYHAGHSYVLTRELVTRESMRDSA
jgi:hypothetical protein